MYKVVRHGAKPSKNHRRFRCDCECIFDTDEFQKSRILDGRVIYHADCPDCGRTSDHEIYMSQGRYYGIDETGDENTITG